MKRLGFALLALCIGTALTDLASPPAKFVAQWPPVSGGDVENLTLVGSTLFGYRGSSTAVFDVSAESRIRQVATLNNAFRRLEAADPYVLEYYVGPLRLLDISRRAAPVEVSTVGVGIIAVTVAWPYVYAAEAGTAFPALVVYDFTVPAHPVEVEGARIPGTWAQLKASGDLLCGVSGTGTLVFFDLKNPRQPVQGGSVSGIYALSPIEISGHTVFVANDKLRIFDASDPSNPTKIGEWTEGSSIFSPFTDVAVIGNTAWLGAANYGTQILDVTNPAAIQKLAYIPGIGFNAHARRQNQLITFEYPFINVFDVSDPTSQKLLGSYVAATPSLEVALTGQFALLQRSHARTDVLDISDSRDPRPVGPGLPEGFGLTISGTNAFLVDTNQTLRMFDISDPASPRQLGSLVIGDSVSSAVAQGSHLYVGISNRVQAIDFANPAALKLDGSVTVPGHSVYLTAGNSGLIANSRYTSNYLSFLSIADPAHPQVAATITNAAYFGRSIIAGNVAYVPDDTTITAWDITDITNPAPGGSVVLGSIASLAFHGTRLYAVAGEVLTVIDISTPLSPKKIYELNNLPTNVGEIAMNSDNYLFVTGVDAGLLVVEVGGELPLTKLHIINEGEMLRVTWPFGTLQSSLELNNTWSPVSARNGDFFMETTVIPDNNSQFFRILEN